jgi:hypothetical protein
MKRVALAILLAASSAATLAAHDTWLLPQTFEARPGTVVTSHATSAMSFPTPETAITAERLARSGVRLGGRTGELSPGRAASGALPLTARMEGEGVAALFVSSRPRTLDLTHDDVEHYLKEIGAWDTVGAEWRKGGRKPWRETYSKVATSFVRAGAGAAAGDRSWAVPIGLPLEIVPTSDPTSVHVGESVSFRVLREGQPVAGQAVGAQPAGGATVLSTTSASGHVSFRLDKGGPWLIKTTVIAPGPAGGWDSVFATVTLAARPKP